jgi:hypothetical protein
MPKNPRVKIQEKNNGWIKVSPLEAQPEPINILHLKREIDQRWFMTSLLDILKEAAQKTGRRVFLLEKQLQAPDHPILMTFPESYYLKGLVVRVE